MHDCKAASVCEASSWGGGGGGLGLYVLGRVAPQRRTELYSGLSASF